MTGVRRVNDLEPPEVRDPHQLRAIAHPIRLRLLDELLSDGPATATELGQRLGQSPANCSWHLRQLARYGFVEEADGRVGRRRPWRAVRRHASTEPPWRDVGFVSHAIAWLTPVELSRLAEQIHPLLTQYADRTADPDHRPHGARQVRLVAWALAERFTDD